MNDAYETYPLDEGTGEELERRAYALVGVISECGKREEIKSVVEELQANRSEESLKRIIQVLRRKFVSATSGDTPNMKGRDWMNAYVAIFGEAPYRIESSYVPDDDEMKNVVRTCLASGVRLNTSVPEGSVG